MKKNPLLLLLAVATLSIAGCALDASTDPVASGTQPVYRTGSNIARSRTSATADGVTSVSGEQAERAIRGTPTMPQPMSGGAH